MSNLVLEAATVGSGSYDPDDVSFLLRSFQIETTGVEERERLIQSNTRHYSEMIGEEHAPTDIHMALYKQALTQNGDRMARDVKSLALPLRKMYAARPLALVSFVRAGLPFGVLLLRALSSMGCSVKHYGVSIVRDRGIDMVALDAIVRVHGAENIVFVDGWTGKGAISGEIRRSLKDDPRFPVDPRLVVLADPCGKAWLSASAEDWIIPSGILGATVSGLVSRSIWPTDGGLHGCMVYDHLQKHDVTRSFVDDISARVLMVSDALPAELWTDAQARDLQSRASGVVDALAERFDITNLNRVKPGIAEATRAVLRRVPDHVLIRSRDDNDVQLLMHLAERAGITVEEVGEQLGPYRAVTIIRNVS